MRKGDLDIDASGVIREAYRIEGIGPQDCRTIFFDWALTLPAGEDPAAAVRALLDFYGPNHPDHPMTGVLREGMGPGARPARRGGRRGRSSSE